MEKSRKEKSKKRDAFKRAAVLITAALLATGLLLTACPTPAPTPDTPTPTEYVEVTYGENGQGLKDYLSSLPKGDTVHKIELKGVPKKAFTIEGDMSPLGKIIKEGGKKVALKLTADISKIDASAFTACINLVSVDLSACTAIEEIDTSAFSYCSDLTEVKLPKYLTSIGLGAFAFASKAEVKLPASIEIIDEAAFGNRDNEPSLCAKVLIPKSKFDYIKDKVVTSKYREDRIEQYED